MEPRDYSAEDIEYALTTLGFFRGDVRKASAFLKVPAKALDRWRLDAERRANATDELAPEIRLFPPGKRPWPPSPLRADRETEQFAPALDVAEWAFRAFLDESSPLYNPEHDHLTQAHVGYLWTNVFCRKQGQSVAGTAEIPQVQGPTWTKRRMEWQLRQWFGAVPDFLITLDSLYAGECSDARFCSLVEHEMLHCGQARDLFGEPRFKVTGEPVFAIRGHDVEEFISIVARYGAGNGAGATLSLVQAAMRPPTIAEADIAGACGTCLRIAA